MIRVDAATLDLTLATLATGRRLSGMKVNPELNPQERLNADLKHAIGTKVPVRTEAKLKLAACEHMTKPERSPEQVKSFF